MKRIAFAALAALAVTGCSDVAPEKLLAPEKLATPAEPSQYAAPYLQVNCPGSIMQGSTGYCSATAYDSNGMPSVAFPIWFSSDNSVLTVSGGVVYGHAPGTALVTANYNGLFGYASVQVKAPPVATSITLSPASKTVRMGSTYTFSAAVKDQYGNTMSGQAVTWSTANSAVATVDATGRVTPQSLGTTTVTATSGTATGSATVTTEPGVSLSGATYAYDQNVTVTASALPSGSYYYVWSSRTCTIGGSCPDNFTHEISGWNITSLTTYVSRYDAFAYVYVELKSSATGAVLATDMHRIGGEGEVSPGGGSCWPQLRC